MIILFPDELLAIAHQISIMFLSSYGARGVHTLHYDLLRVEVSVIK